MSSPWYSLQGVHGYAGGSAGGSVTIPTGAAVLQIVAHANPASTLVIFGGDSLALPASLIWRAEFPHTSLVSTASANTLVFGANVTSYFVEWIKSGVA
jgi:hypothetical protein